MRISSVLFAAISVALCGTAQAETVTFTPLQTQDAQVTMISPNGEYAVSSIFQTAAIRWTAATGAEELVDSLNEGLGINDAGTISGSAPENGGSSNGGRDLGAYAPLGGNAVLLTDTLQTNSTGYGISSDGTVVGLSFEDEFAGAAVAFAWTAAEGMTALPVNRPLNYSRANAISADGHVIVGWNDQDDGSRTAVIWRDRVPTDMVGADGEGLGEANAISANGNFVVGSGYADENGNYGSWRWDATNGLTLIPMGFAFGVSNDGKTVVGANGFFDNPPRAAMIWREGVGAMMLTDYLTQHGITIPADWDPDLAGGFGAISADGSVMGGWTFNMMGMVSYIVQVEGAGDEIFKNGFDAAKP